jgi:hypothetical protein
MPATAPAASPADAKEAGNSAGGSTEQPQIPADEKVPGASSETGAPAGAESTTANKPEVDPAQAGPSLGGSTPAGDTTPPPAPTSDDAVGKSEAQSH